MKITKSKLRQIIKEELIREVSSLQREEEEEEARCVGFMHKRSDELSKTLPSLNEDGPMISDILIQLQLQYLSLEHHELKRFQRKAGNCYKLFVKALEEVGAEGSETWEETRKRFVNSRYRDAVDEYENYYKSQMSPKKMVDPVRVRTATRTTQPRVNTEPLYKAPVPSSNPFKVKKLGRDGKYRQ